MEPALHRGRRGLSIEDESLRSAIAIAIFAHREIQSVFVKMNSFDALLSQSHSLLSIGFSLGATSRDPPLDFSK